MGSKIAFLLKRVNSTIYLNIPPAIGLLAQILTLPVVLASLSLKDFGLYQFVIALETWLNVFTAPHISLGAKRGIAKGLDGTLVYSYFNRLKLFLIVNFFVWVAGFIFLKFENFKSLGILFFILGAYSCLSVLAQATWQQFFIAKKKFGQYAICYGIILFSVPIVGAISSIATGNIILFAGVQLGLTAFLNIIILVFIFKKYNLLDAYKKKLIDYEVVPYGIRLMPESFASSASEKGAVLIAGPLLGFSAVAVFSIADRLVIVFRTLANSAYHLLYADFANLEWSELTSKLRRHFKIGIFLSLVISSFFVISGYIYIQFFLPSFYQLAKVYLLIMGLGLLPLPIKGALQAALESSFKSREILIVSVVPTVLRILLYVVIGYLFGLIGIACVVVIISWLELFLYYISVMGKK